MGLRPAKWVAENWMSGQGYSEYLAWPSGAML